MVCVSDEKLGVSNENMGVSNENMGVSNVTMRYLKVDRPHPLEIPINSLLKEYFHLEHTEDSFVQCTVYNI